MCIDPRYGARGRTAPVVQPHTPIYEIGQHRQSKTNKHGNGSQRALIGRLATQTTITTTVVVLVEAEKGWGKRKRMEKKEHEIKITSGRNMCNVLGEKQAKGGCGRGAGRHTFGSRATDREKKKDNLSPATIDY